MRLRLVMFAIVAFAFCLCPLRSDVSAAHRVHELRFADGQDVTHLNPLLVTTYPEGYAAQLTGAYLTRLGHHGQPVPELARELPTLRNGGISADGKSIVYHLRPNLRFSDGLPLTASDVVFTANVIIGKDTPVVETSGWDKIAGVDSPHAGDVRFRLKQPYSPALATFFCSYNSYAILPEQLLRGKDMRTADFNRLPVGAGPFRYAAFAPGSKIVMEANPFYFRGRPKLDKIEYVFIPDENTVATQVLTGEIDLAIRQQPTQLRRLQASPDITFVRSPSGNGGYIAFQTAKPPFDDRRVRLALRYAIDRRQLLETVYHGSGSISDDPVTPLDPFYGGGVPTSAFDMQAAAALLDRAGFHLDSDGLRRRNGRALTVDIVDFTGNAIAATIVELVRAQWAKLGVSLNSRTVNGDVVYAVDGIAARGDFGALIYGEAITSAELDANFACADWPPSGFNYQRYCNPRVDALIARANANYDDVARAKLYFAARALIAADASTISTIHREDVHAMRKSVTGFRPGGLTVFDDVMDLDVR